MSIEVSTLLPEELLVVGPADSSFSSLWTRSCSFAFSSSKAWTAPCSVLTEALWLRSSASWEGHKEKLEKTQFKSLQQE